MKIVAIADTHCQWDKLNMPDGDILIIAGDIGYDTSLIDLAKFNEWLGKLSYKHIICIAGNHDFIFQNDKYAAISTLTNAIYLEETGCNVMGLNIWGSPYSPKFFSWAFMAQRGDEITKHWELIPKDLDILITHGPPLNILDFSNYQSTHSGCYDLDRIINKQKPKFHFFGHIHESYGNFKNKHTHYFNASVVNDDYEVVNKPMELEIKEPKNYG